MQSEQKKKHSALNYILYLVAKRDYSEAELRKKLAQKEYTEEEIELAISKAQSHRWQDDQRFCAGFIRYRAQQGYGPRRLQQELRQKGIEEWLIEQEMAETEVDWFELAEQVFEKKRPKIWDFKAKQKMWRYMLSHGFYSEHFEHLTDLEYDEGDDEEY